MEYLTPNLISHVYDLNNNEWSYPFSIHTPGGSDVIEIAYDTESDQLVCVTKNGQNDSVYIDIFDANTNSWEYRTSIGVVYIGNYDVVYDIESDKTVILYFYNTDIHVIEYDVNSNTWEQKSSHSIGNEHLLNACYSSNSDRTILTNWVGGDLATYSYDLNSDQWETKSSLIIGTPEKIGLTYNSGVDRVLLVKYENSLGQIYSYYINDDIWTPHSQIDLEDNISNVELCYDIESDTTLLLTHSAITENVNVYGYNFRMNGWTSVVSSLSGVGNQFFDAIYWGSNPIFHVSTTGSDNSDTGSESNPFATIQHAIDRSVHGDTILVHPGTYIENINFNGHNIVVGSLFLTTQDTSYISSTIIDGNQVGSVVTFENGEDVTAQLLGFTIQNGHIILGGGGIRCFNTSPSIIQNIITGNTAQQGGGIYCYYSNPTLEHLNITNNSADHDGGGIHLTFSNPNINNILVQNNEAIEGGGGINYHYSSPYTSNSIINYNSTDGKGGGIHIGNNSNPVLSNILLTNNSAVTGGGLDVFASSSPTIINTTISNNSSTYGGGIYLDSDANPIIINSILWDNIPQEIEMSNLSVSNSITVSWSDVQGGQASIITNSNGSIVWNTGNISSDPIFNDVGIGDYTLNGISPCIDSGNPDLDGDGATWETDPDDRDPDSTRMDMGAYYYHQLQDPPIEPPDTLWTKTYGGNQIDIGYSVEQTTDNGYIITGLTNSYTNGNADVLLVKTDSLGNNEWLRNFGGFQDDEGWSVKQTYDGGYVILGRTYSFGNGNSDFWVIKTDSNGNEEWNQTFGGGSADYGYDMQRTEDHGYILTGLTYSYGAGSYDVWLIKIDSDGNEEWNETYGGSGWDGGYSVQQINDGGYIICGRTDSFGSGFFDVWLIKTDESGNAQWYRTFGGSNNDEGWSVDYTTDGGYIIAGLTNYTIALIKTNDSGYEDWTQTYGSGHGYSVEQVTDGGYVVTGVKNSDLIVIKTDSNGIEEWNTILDGSDLDEGRSGQLKNDGGYIVTGRRDFVSDNSSNVWLISLEQFVDPPYYGPVWHISTIGSDTTGNGAESNPFATIQYGIDQSSNGDTILVHPGTYVENIDFSGKNIVLVSRDGPDSTLIDGNNYYPVVEIHLLEDSSAVLDGFTITNGNGSGSFAAISIWSASPKVKNCIISDNNNGGIYIGSYSAAIESCIIRNNIAPYGAGIKIGGGSPTFVNCIIDSNTAVNGGGGVFISGFSDSVFDSCSISENQAQNSSDAGGGGFSISSDEVGHFTSIIHSSIYSNHTTSRGGGISIWGDASVVLDNVKIYNNMADYMAGGVYVSVGSSISANGSLIYGNIADLSGGIFCNGEAQFVNSIFWKDSTITTGQPDEIDGNLFNITILYSNVMGGFTGLGNINIPPLFCNEQEFDFSVAANSPMLGNGENGANIGGVEVGCDATYNGPSWFVSTNGSDMSLGSETDPFSTIQYAVNIANNGDTIVIMPGTYEENITISIKNLVLTGQSDSYNTVIQPLLTNYQTIKVEDVDSISIKNLTLNGNNSGAGVWVYNCPRSTLDHVQLTGFIDYGGQWSSSSSADTYFVNIINSSINKNVNGLNLFGTTGTLYNVVIDSNNTGLRFDTGQGNDLTLTNVQFLNNEKDSQGAGLWVNQSSAGTVISIDSCEYSNNVNNVDIGAAIYISSGSDSITVKNSLFQFNFAYNSGSAIVATGEQTNIDLLNCSFIQNSCQSLHGVIKTDSKINIQECLFISNQGPSFGSTGTNINYTVRNSIIWNNPVSALPADSISISYSCVENGWFGIGNISDNPELCDPYSNAYALALLSPCIGTGWNNSNIGGLEVGCDEPENHTLILDINASDGGNGSNEFPINNIHGAVQNVFSGDTISILPGIYDVTETLNIEKNIYFEGTDSSDCILFLDASSYEIYSNGQNVINLSIGFENIKFLGSDNLIEWTFMLLYGDYLFKSCVFQNIDNTYLLRVSNSNLDLINCHFLNNNAQEIRSWGDEGNNNITIDNTSFDGSQSVLIYVINESDSIYINQIQLGQNNFVIDAGYISLKNSDISNCNFSLRCQEGNIVGNNFICCSTTYSYLLSVYNGQISDCLFIDNDPLWSLIGLENQNTTIINKCTFGHNKSKIVYLESGGTGILRNSIFQGGEDILYFNGNSNQSFSTYYSLVDFVDGSGWGQTGQYEENVIYSNPMFADTSDNNFNLLWGSPAIDAGDPNYILDPDSTRADMGALYYDQTDTIPPVIIIISPTMVSQFGTEDTLSVNWNAEDSRFLSWAKIYFSDGGSSSFELLDSVEASLEHFEWPIPDSVISTDCKVKIEISDHRNNITADTSEYFTIYDNTLPIVNIITPGEEFSIPEHEYLNIEWNASDNGQIDLFESYFYNANGIWSTSGVPISGDSSSTGLWIPAGVFDSARVMITAIDTSGNSGQGISHYFSVTDNTPPTVSLLTPTSGEEFGIGSKLNITWLAEDNVSVSGVDLYYSTNNSSSWSTISESEINDGIYDWMIPNEPSDQVGLRLVVEDAVSLKDTTEVMGMSITIEYPIVVSIDPDPTESLSWLGRDSGVHIQFSQSILEPIDKDSVIITCASGTILEPYFTNIVADSILWLWILDGFPTSDTISIELKSRGFTNIYGYKLDGNDDGVSGDDYKIDFTTTMLADYDTSNAIDILDLAQFIQALEEDNYYYELGPVKGTAPNFTTYTDSVFNIEDVMAFVMMWNWYVITSEPSFQTYAVAGTPITVETTVDSIIIDVPDGALVYEIQVKYDPQTLMIGDQRSSSDIRLSNLDEENGIYRFMAGAITEDKLRVSISILGKKTDLAISFRVAGYDSRIISQMTKEIQIINIPTEFALHQNYPNPFNPITTIEYDLPEDGNLKLAIYDILGREVIELANGFQEAGYRSVQWNGRNAFGQIVSAGMYFYAIEAGKYSAIRKMVLLK